mmetsp:Transcript_82759/g.146563  ORF Transcript_82759/g.146563 Transcript_82759/m.146563 type:complete len:336 (+) Transcript_82759:86-1093(+)
MFFATFWIRRLILIVVLSLARQAQTTTSADRSRESNCRSLLQLRFTKNGTGSGNQSLLQEEDEAATKLHRAEQKIKELQQELMKAKGPDLDWEKIASTLKEHWLLTGTMILVACCILPFCCLCGPSCVLRTGEQGCENVASCTSCCIKTDWFLLKSTWQLIHAVWTGLHDRTRATILIVNFMTAGGIAILWWFTSDDKHKEGSEYLLLLTVRWCYLGLVMCCLPGILFLTISCCEFWAFLADFGNNFSDYIMEVATDFVDFQEQVTHKTAERCTEGASQCWQGLKKTCGCASESPSGPEVDVRVQTVAKSIGAVQSKTKRERVRPMIKLQRIPSG